MLGATPCALLSFGGIFPRVVSIDRISAGRTKQRLNEHPIKPKTAPVSELLNPNRHALVAGLWLRQISAQDPVPPWDIEAKVAVGFGWPDGVMDAVHVRRDNEQPQNRIDL